MNKIGSNPVRGALLRSSLLRLGDTANPYIEGYLGFNAGLDEPERGHVADASGQVNVVRHRSCMRLSEYSFSE